MEEKTRFVLVYELPPHYSYQSNQPQTKQNYDCSFWGHGKCYHVKIYILIIYGTNQKKRLHIFYLTLLQSSIQNTFVMAILFPSL